MEVDYEYLKLFRFNAYLERGHTNNDFSMNTKIYYSHRYTKYTKVLLLVPHKTCLQQLLVLPYLFLSLVWQLGLHAFFFTALFETQIFAALYAKQPPFWGHTFYNSCCTDSLHASAWLAFLTSLSYTNSSSFFFLLKQMTALSTKPSRWPGSFFPSSWQFRRYASQDRLPR